MLNKSWAAIFAVLLFALTGCAAKGTTANVGSANLAQPFSAEHYAVAPTDILRIDVYREADLSGEYYVDPSGTINLPLVGRIAVAGLNVQAIEYRLTQRLGNGFIVDPDVRVSVLKFRPIYVTGEVSRPGQYPFTPGMTVQQAIVLAGGATRFASKSYFLQRPSASQGKPIRVDANSVLFPGDVVTLGERLF